MSRNAKFWPILFTIPKVVTRLVNYIMLDGKKGVAQEIVYDALNIVKEKTGNDPLEMFEKAMENIMPNLECKDPPCRRC